MKKLIVLLTKSDHDWAVLRTKLGFPQQGIAYFECEQGKYCSAKPLECERLLCIITLNNKKENTKNTKKTLSHCPDHDVVIGTHTQDVSPTIVLDLSQYPNIATANFSTGWEQFAFMEAWCEELAKTTPNAHAIKHGFDRLFRLLKIPYKLEAYFDTTLNLSFDYKAGAVRAMTDLASKIEHAVSDAESNKLDTLKKTILNWDINQREADITGLNDQFFKFAEKEFLDRYLDFSDME